MAIKRTYILHFKLTKHRAAKGFTCEATAKDGDDLQSIKEERAMYFEEQWGTPVKCVKVTEKLTKENENENLS